MSVVAGASSLKRKRGVETGTRARPVRAAAEAAKTSMAMQNAKRPKHLEMEVAENPGPLMRWTSEIASYADGYEDTNELGNRTLSTEGWSTMGRGFEYGGGPLHGERQEEACGTSAASATEGMLPQWSMGITEMADIIL
ncbi:hypothetical protein DL769_009797 [Monosporascus sp. CRB-8-3]|nr:hypothetical protein DL769_009797 [Monosporascus sp. CRB-8-3]